MIVDLKRSSSICCKIGNINCYFMIYSTIIKWGYFKKSKSIIRWVKSSSCISTLCDTFNEYFIVNIKWIFGKCIWSTISWSRYCYSEWGGESDSTSNILMPLELLVVKTSTDSSGSPLGGSITFNELIESPKTIGFIIPVWFIFLDFALTIWYWEVRCILFLHYQL